MAFDVVMFGSLSLPERHVEEWLAAPVEQARYPWLDEVGGTDVLHETPDALLSFLQGLPLAPHELLSLTLEAGRVTIAAYACEDTYRETSQALALLFASAGEFGGVGELHFAGYQGIRFGERLLVRAGQCTFTNITPEALARLEQRKDFQALDARIHERFDSLVGRPSGGPVDPRRSCWVVHPFTGRRVRVPLEPAGAAQ